MQTERNKIVNDAPPPSVKPSPKFSAKDVVKKISTSNFEDNMKDIAGCDWIIEVCSGRLDIKQKVFEAGGTVPNQAPSSLPIIHRAFPFI